MPSYATSMPAAVDRAPLRRCRPAGSGWCCSCGCRRVRAAAARRAKAGCRSGPPIGQCAMSSARRVPSPAAISSSLGPEGAVEEHDVAPRPAPASTLGRRPRRAREVRERAPARPSRMHEADVVLRRRRARQPLEVQRQLARRRGSRSTATAVARAMPPSGCFRPSSRRRQVTCPGKRSQRPVEHVALGEARAHGVGRIDHQRVRFAQRQQAEAMVEIAVGQQDAGDRRVPLAARGYSSGQASIWARISGEALIRNQDSPSALIATDSCVRGHGAAAQPARPTAVGAAAVPLRETATRRGTQNPDLQARAWLPDVSVFATRWLAVGSG